MTIRNPSSLVALARCALAFAFVVSALAAAPTSPTPLVTQTPEKLIAVLKSDANRKAKADACRELAVVGGSSAVPVLVSLLANEEMSHMARYALETMTDASVSTALRSELPKLHGRPLIGVIGSLGVRKDIKAVKPLSGLFRDADSGVAQAAARALGSIGTAEAAKALQAALPKVEPASRLAFYEGLFRCAENLADGGKNKQARGIYDGIRREAELPAQVRVAALRGAILMRGAHDLALLKECLTSSDYLLFTTGVRAALETPGVEATQALAESLPRVAAGNQVVILQALGSRRQFEALPAIEAAVKQGAPATRLAAVRALGAIGHPSAVVPFIRELMETGGPEVAQAAVDALAGMPGREADGAALDLLTAGDAAHQLTGIELIGRRRMTAAVPALMKTASEGDAKVRPVAWRRLGELAGPNEVPALVALLLRATEAPDLEAGSEALKTICTRAGKPQSLTEQMAAATAKAQPAQKGALLNVLCALGGTKPLEAVRAAMSDSSPDVRNAAIRALADWPDPAAAPDLLAIARAPSENAQRVVAFRGFVRMAGEHSVPTAQKLKMLNEIALLAGDSQDKKLVLSALGEITSVESLRLTTAYFTDPLVADEAGAAAVKIAERLDAKDKDEIGLVLKQVLKTSNSEPVLASARKCLEKWGIPPE